MANKDMPKGAEPCGRLYECQVYKAESAVYPGDFLIKNANGTVAALATAAVGGDAIVGVAMNYAAAEAEVLVADHPDQKFVIQAAGSDIDAQTDIGMNANISVGSPNATYKRSGMELDDATLATTATLPLKVVAVDRSVDNALGANCKVVVRINNHQNASGTGVAGV